MHLRLVALLALPPTLGLVVPAQQAHACGGCFVQQTESTQVSGHRMVLSVSQGQTTLWDQISYDGDPSEFAWVLPIRGQVDVGTSSDALFQVLEGNTQVVVSSPQINCQPSTCNDSGNFGSSGTGTGGGEPPVTVIAEEVVGPYETVQLASTDPAALNQWLTDHGYNIPADIQPVIASYVNEGFGFLALRLVPGQGITSMKPVRVTTPGASPVLPLRMVAAGTGAVTPITLFVLGEGRYEPQNFPAFRIAAPELVWNWDTQSSNYADLRQQGFAYTDGAGWLLEAGEQYGSWVFTGLVDTATYDPEGSGYADENGLNAVENAEADVLTLLSGIPEETLWISRMSAELPKSALAFDLALQASSDQTWVERYFYVQNEVGTRPECPPQQPCGDSGSGTSGDPGGWEGDGDWTDPGENGNGILGDGGCGVARGSSAPTLFVGAMAFAGLALARRRRQQRRRSSIL